MNDSSTNDSPNYQYHAFISYRHADNKEQGRQWATWLHQAIETYEVPADLVGQENGRGEVIPARIYPIFRDEEELPANADLGKSIVGALDSTRLLIVLCSPRAVESTYVADEIHYFKQQGHSDRIIAAIIDGEPNTSWDKGKQAAGFKVEDECFPLPLQFEYDETGNRTDKHAEPIAADFRINNDGVPEQSWTSPEAYRLHLQKHENLDKTEIESILEKYQTQQQLMLLKIIAGILGVPLGELTQRDKAYQLAREQLKAKKLRRWLTAVAGLAIIAIAAGFLAYTKQKQAETQTQIAQVSESKTVAQSAVVAFNRGEYRNSIELALSVLPRSFEKPQRGYSVDAEAILSSAVFHNKLIFSGKGDKLWTDLDWLNKDPYENQVSSDSSRLIIYGAAAPVIINLLNNKRVSLEEIPTGQVWSSHVSSKGNYIAAETGNGKDISTYVWSTRDGRLQIKENARFDSFSYDETMIGFLEKKPKKQTKNNSKRGYLLDINTAKVHNRYVGELVFVDKTNDRLILQEKNKCRSRHQRTTRCEVITKVQSLSGGETSFEFSGELVASLLTERLYLSKNSHRSVNNNQQSSPGENETGVALWDFENEKQMRFYPGAYAIYDKASSRLFTIDERTQRISLWDLENDKLIAEINGKLIPHTPSWYQDEIDKLLLVESYDGETFLVEQGREESRKTLRYLLSNGQLVSETKGRYLGLSNENSILTYLPVEVEVDGRFVDRSLIFSEGYNIPLIKMDNEQCESEEGDFSNYPLMPRVEANVVLFNCNNNIALYYPGSSNPGRPEFIPSKYPAQWVTDGGLFWFGKDFAEVMHFSYWEGGGIHAERMLRVELKDRIEFRSLVNGKYLLAQTPDSGISLWDSSGEIFEPVITIEEHEFSADYLKYFSGDELSKLEKKVSQKKEVMTKLGFDFHSLKSSSQRQPDFDNYVDERWSKKDIVSEEISSKFESFDAQSVLYLNENKLAVVLGEKNVYLVNVASGLEIAKLSRVRDISEYYFEGFDDSYGVSESPNHNGFLFYSPNGVWLFDMQGKLKLTLCDDSNSCQYPIDFKWLKDKESIFVMNKRPLIYSLKNGSEINLCKSFSTISDCRDTLRSSILFGNNTIATGEAIFDYDSGIRILELPGELGGMFAHPWEFNENESALMMSAETGGGTAIYGIWKLPERGESLLQRARSEYLQQ